MNERNDDFRSRVGIAGDVTGKIPHIGDDDCGFPNGRRPAYPLAKLNSSAGGLTLKRPENHCSPSTDTNLPARSQHWDSTSQVSAAVLAALAMKSDSSSSRACNRRSSESYNSDFSLGSIGVGAVGCVARRLVEVAGSK